jgi:large subunit ribosomal protein L17
MFALQFLSEEGPNTELVGLLLVVLGIFFLIVIIGWLASRNQKPAAAPVQVEHSHEEHKHEDDLEIIEGIGPKVAKVLKAAGIVSFSDLANAPVAKVEDALKAAGLNMMSAPGWIEQAKLAAKGDKEGLKKMQAEMKGGRLK